MLGSRLSTIAYPMLVLYLTNSPVYAGFSVFAATAPGILVYIPAGALVDRWEPRRTMLASETGRGIATASVVVTLALHPPNVPLIICLAAIEQTLEVFSTLAERRYVQCLVEQQDISSALASTELRAHVVVLAGRPLGGLLFELSPILPFLTDLLSFFISVGTLFGIRNRQPVQRAQIQNARLLNEVRDGLRQLRDDPFVGRAVLLQACMTVAAQSLIMVFVVDAQSWHLSSETVGIVLAAAGLGGIIGTAIGLRRRLTSRYSLITLQPCICSVALLVLTLVAASWQIPCIAMAMIVFGFTGSRGNIELDTYLMQEIPGSMLARVTSIGRLMQIGACAAGPALGGILIGSLGIQRAVNWLFVMTLIVAMLSVRAPSRLLSLARACISVTLRAIARVHKRVMAIRPNVRSFLRPRLLGTPNASLLLPTVTATVLINFAFLGIAELKPVKPGQHLRESECFGISRAALIVGPPFALLSVHEELPSPQGMRPGTTRQ
jgi:MFS family permease